MDFILSIAKSLLSSLGAKMLSSIFPASAPSYFGAIITEIQTLIHIEAVANDILQIKGSLDGVITLMSIDYVNKKNVGASAAEMMTFLGGVHQTLEENVMGPLEALTDTANAKGNAQQSLLVYLLGGGLQLSVLQEMALTDPDAKDGQPINSQYAGDAQDYAEQYAARAKSLLAALRVSRLASIQVPSESSAPEPADPVQGDGEFWPTGTRIVTTSIYDGWLDAQVCVHTQAWGLSTPNSDIWAATLACAGPYIQNAGPLFDAQWANASQTIGAWELLAVNPLPPPLDFTLNLANGFQSSCGAQVIANAFPLGLPSYFGVIIDQTKSLMHVDDVSADVTNLQNNVDGVINQMLVDYPTTRSAPGTTKQDLIAFLSPLKNTLETDVMTPLQALADSSVAKGNAQQSLLAYLFCGGVLLAVLQEMALQDPQAATPSASQYATQIKNDAAQFASYVFNLFIALEGARMSSISPPQLENGLVPGAQPAQPVPGQSGQPTLPLTTFVEDGWLNTQACLYAGNFPIGWPEQMIMAQTADARESYLGTVLETFQTDWASFNSMKNVWNMLEFDPLGVPAQ